MGNWTYINGTIVVSPMGRTQYEADYILKTVLAHLPVVDGGEGDMEVHISQNNNYDSSCSVDEFGQHTDKGINSRGIRSVKTGMFRKNENYILTIDAALSDREFETIFVLFQKWLCRLAKRVFVRDILIRIQDYYNRTTLDYSGIEDNPYYHMFEDPTWTNNDGCPNWCEYLMWDRGVNTSLPMSLEYKYFNNPDNDKEFERRYLEQKNDS